VTEIRPPGDASRGAGIVVGVDGSACSVVALRWALAQAVLTGDHVEAVAAWQNPAVTDAAYGWLPQSLTSQDVRAAMQTSLTAAVDCALKESPEPAGTDGVRIDSHVAEGHPVQVLLEAAAHARLLVLGSRGHGGFAGMLLGSVSQRCVQHAPCAVVVVPA
jgi:nucleotide-binding universal stress UspA family protein